MLFRSAHNAVLIQLEVKERDQVISHKLGGNRTTDKRGEFRRTERKVLLNLHDAESVTSPLRLNRESIVRPASINAYVYFIRFDLSQRRYGCPKVILQ